MFKWDGLIPDDPEYVERDLIIPIGAAMGGILFGLLHSLARNNEFPTRLEGLLWDIAVLVTAFVFLTYIPLAGSSSKAVRIWKIFTAGVYIIARLYPWRRLSAPYYICPRRL